MAKKILRLTSIVFSVFFCLLLFVQSYSFADTDVTDKIELIKGRLRYDRRAKTSYVDISLQNISQDTLQTPLKIIINSITDPAVTLSNPDGTTDTGKPYFEYDTDSGSLGPGETTGTKKWIFYNPLRKRFNFVIGSILSSETQQNNPPVANAGPDQEYPLAYGQTALEITLDGSGSQDPDGTVSTYTWTGSPDPADEEQPVLTIGEGTYEFALTVTDNDGAESTPDTVQVVINPPENQRPVADAGPEQTHTLSYGQTEIPVSLTGSGSHDPDGVITDFIWTCESGLPDPEDVPEPSVTLTAGRYTFSLVVTDDDGATSLADSVTIVITPAPSVGGPPVISINPLSYTVLEGDSLSIDVLATDPDGDVVSISASPKLDNAQFTCIPGTQATGTFNFSPDHTQQGMYVIAFKARDPLGLTATKTIQIKVINVNRAPAISAPDEMTVDEGSLLTILIQAVDPDNDILTLSATPLPGNAIFIPATGTITFTPDFDQAGTYSINCQAHDGELGASRTVEVIVNNVSGSTPQDLVLDVHPVETPTFLDSTRITGTVNSSGTAPPRLTSALIAQMDPVIGKQGETFDVILTGEASGDFETHFAENISQADFGNDIIINSLSISSPTEAVVNISIAPNALEGPRSVNIVTDKETAISTLAFNVVKGQTSATGILVDADTEQAIAGATVTIQGTNITTVTNADGSFTFTGVSTGEHVVIINAQDHELITMTINSQVGVTSDIGTVESSSTVFDPSSASTLSVGSLLLRGITDETRGKTIEEARQLVIDAFLVVGGKEIGVLDEYGNELNPNIEGRPFITLPHRGVNSTAMRMIAGRSTTLGAMLWGFTSLWEWSDEPPNLSQWLHAIQSIVDRAWQNPNDPESALLFLLFNPGTTIGPQSPQIVADIPLNALQAQLMSLTLLRMALRSIDPEALHEDAALIIGAVSPESSPTKFARIFNSFTYGRKIAKDISDFIVRPAYAQEPPVAKAQRPTESATINNKLLLSAEDSYSVEGLSLTYAWTVESYPAGSSGDVLTRDSEMICYFWPDVVGEYTIRLVVQDDNGPSPAYNVTIKARNYPCAEGGDPDWEGIADRPWVDVLCELGGVVTEQVKGDITNAGIEFIKNGFTLGDPESRAQAATEILKFIEPEPTLHSQTIATNARAYEKVLPEIMAMASEDPGLWDKAKKFVVGDLMLGGAIGILEEATNKADQMNSDFMYFLLDKMIAKMVESMKPAPPFILNTELLDNPYIEDKYMVKITFSRSPDDNPEEDFIPARKLNPYFSYILWRQSPDGGLLRLLIGYRGDPWGPGVDDDGNFYFLDPQPAEGHNVYYVQTRRIIGKSMSITRPWSEGKFWFEQMIGEVCPPAAPAIGYANSIADRAMTILEGIKIQDSDLTSPERLYVPRPFERPAPAVSLSSTPVWPYNGNILISFPFLDSIFQLKGNELDYVLTCGFKDPHQVGMAVDARGNIYADNSASDMRFGGRIFRWHNLTKERQLFGSVQYYSQLLQYAKTCTVKNMTAGIVGGHEKLFITDLYSNAILELDIPAGGELPSNPDHYVGHSINAPDMDIRSNSCMAVSPVGVLYMTQGDNILRYDGSAPGSLLFPSNKPFTELSGIAFDSLWNMYLADFQAGTITVIPPDKQNPLFWSEIENDPMVRNLYTIRTGLNRPGEIHIAGDNRSLVWFDGGGFHFMTFGLSGRIIDNATGQPLAGASVSCEERGEKRQARTDENGIFHLPGLLLPGYPNVVPILIRHGDKADNKRVYLKAFGQTILPSIVFKGTIVPPGSGGPMPEYELPAPPLPASIYVTAGNSVFLETEVETLDLPLPDVPDPASPGTPGGTPLPPQAPAVKIIMPTNGLKTNDAQLQVVGVVSDVSITTATLFVNGNARSVNVANGVFTASVNLDNGPNKLRAQASVTVAGSTLTGTSQSIDLLRTTATVGTGSIAGRVIDESEGYALPGVRVLNNRTGESTLTDNFGAWEFTEIPDGLVTIEIMP